ncbi:acetyl/propionyl-CoA carboxylase, alpha chain [Nitzschia inconspicua]|uniref:Acetyl/propionyl-CoA carboxylase, alpha chain n=1 Tax=Nitzschia inconspicua TaxID=303405 RepID=A0A9K3PJL3_9STRA|nr:acetyl/propionyl-CoA carboxylase, alpha chain [Nitzschia inconspicua]
MLRTLWHHPSRRFLSRGGTRSLSSFYNASTDDRPFQKVLIANRGEIACRVIRTCRQLQIPTVALYSDADGPNSLHASMADEAYLIGTGPHPSESYLLQDEVLDIALRSGAQGIHPGYGFLSENAIFCEKVNATDGLTFIGPPVPAITAMGSKSQSKAIMEQAGVPTTPGFYDASESTVQDPQELLQEALQIGFPLLIKAVMGGGGKGMRLVWKDSEFLDKLEACQRESQNSFGDARVLLEKYLLKPRHVEVQVVGDHHGNYIHLFERDCSLQRRHQKIIEEAPASDLPSELRERLGEMGKRAAEAVGYYNAGTVEFLLDTQEPDQFYFCEMNTRLQVEHPITELITGVDLVEWQLRIAAGEILPILNQDDMPCHGHALEARIYAENPARNFLPATGTVWHHAPPAESNTGINAEGVRVDTGIRQGAEVGVYYDPMICKLIVHDQTRDKALKKLVLSLQQYQIAGVPTNIDFLIRCAQHHGFQEAGAVNTGFLDDYMDEVLPGVSEDGVMSENEALPSVAVALGVFASLLKLEGRIGIENVDLERRRRPSPWNSLSGSWINGGSLRRKLELSDGTTANCTSCRDGSYQIQILSEDEQEKTSFHVNGVFSSNQELKVVVNHTHRITLTTALHEVEGIIQVCMWPRTSELIQQGSYFWQVLVKNPMVPSSLHNTAASVGHGMIKAPMPGKISRVNFAVGDTVEAGDVLLLMEAMKMEHTIVSPVAGVLQSITYKVGDVVVDGAMLAVVGSEDDEEPEAV